jgi:hypothetical protein
MASQLVQSEILMDLSINSTSPRLNPYQKYLLPRYSTQELARIDQGHRVELLCQQEYLMNIF